MVIGSSAVENPAVATRHMAGDGQGAHDMLLGDETVHPIFARSAGCSTDVAMLPAVYPPSSSSHLPQAPTCVASRLLLFVAEVILRGSAVVVACLRAHLNHLCAKQA